MSAALLSCPFCGADRPTISSDFDADGCRSLSVRCHGCGARSRPVFSSDPCPLTYQEVRDDWNRRASIPPIPVAGEGATGERGKS